MNAMRRVRRTLRALGLAVVLATVAGCEPDATAVATHHEFPSQAALPADFQQLARGLAAGALDEVRHEGVRLVEVFEHEGDAVERIAYRERIATDGEGRFSIRFLEAVTALPPDTASFALQHYQREGLNYRYRDFAIRDDALFRRNYSMERREGTVEIAGRPCTEYDVRSASGSGYTVAVDDGTGIALRYTERDAEGRVVAAMRYETFASRPDPGTAYHRSWVDEQPLTWNDASQRELDRSGALRPRLAPRGYELHEASTVTDTSGERWLKLEYTDGVECAFFLCALPDADRAAVASRTGADEAVVFRMGVATVVQANLRGRQLVAVGKVGERELLDLLESALP